MRISQEMIDHQNKFNKLAGETSFLELLNKSKDVEDKFKAKRLDDRKTRLAAVDTNNKETKEIKEQRDSKEGGDRCDDDVGAGYEKAPIKHTTLVHRRPGDSSTNWWVSDRILKLVLVSVAKARQHIPRYFL